MELFPDFVINVRAGSQLFYYTNIFLDSLKALRGHTDSTNNQSLYNTHPIMKNQQSFIERNSPTHSFKNLCSASFNRPTPRPTTAIKERSEQLVDCPELNTNH